MKKLYWTLFLVLLFHQAFADEGMWVPSLLGEGKIREMQEKGLKLSAEDLYDINHSSLKDAVVLFGRGCTGTIVSDQGLLLTNHHCGYGQIQSHSSIEHDYLTDGFWAMSLEEELPCPGLTVTLLIRMEDVTAQALEGVIAGMPEAGRQKAIEANSKRIVEKAVEGTHYQASVEPLFAGNQYFLYVKEIFKDVRLVGAPPSAIGHFGGDTDNWMWPRHTGDFSIFRIYAGTDNKPADHAAANRPYQPARALEISLEPIQKGDFTMVYGYPYSTSEYMPSSLIRLMTESSNPARIAIRQAKLEIISAASLDDLKVRIQYASKRAGIANAWKKWIGVDIGLARYGAIEKKIAFENQFRDWSRMKEEDDVAAILPAFGELARKLEPVQHWTDHFSEAIWSMDIIKFAARFRNLVYIDYDKEKEFQAEVQNLLKEIPGFFKDFDQPTDKKIFIRMIELFRENVSPSEWPGIYQFIDHKFRGNVPAFAGWAYEKSILADQDAIRALLEENKSGLRKKIAADPFFKVMKSFYDRYSEGYSAQYKQMMVIHDSLQRLYMSAIMEMRPGLDLYPDANATLRITYGQVDDYIPADATRYEYYTTLAGVMEKDDPEVYDYCVPDRLKELYRLKDYGPYAIDGEMRVCFTASNHTTGGNSGSPVLNDRGQLLGLNFDRNWEGTMSDVMYDPSMCRNIVLDIHYCLFIIDRFAGAGRLINEMTIAR